MFSPSLPKHIAHAGRSYSIMRRLERLGKPLYFKPAPKFRPKEKSSFDKDFLKFGEEVEEHFPKAQEATLGPDEGNKNIEVKGEEKHGEAVDLSEGNVKTESEVKPPTEISTIINKPMGTVMPEPRKRPSISIKVDRSKLEPASMEVRMPKIFRNFQQPESPKVSKVAILGPANAGKSTLLNRLVDNLVSIVSPRPQTTRKRTQGVMTLLNTQVIFLDSPGVTIGSRNELKGITHDEKAFNKLRFDREVLTSPWRCLDEADHLVVLLDANKCLYHRTIAEDYIFSKLEKSKVTIPATLVINKVDSINCNAAMLRVIVDKYMESYKHFDLVPHYISALKGDGVGELRERLLQTATPRPWLYPGHIKTDMSDYERVVEMVREAYYSRLQSYLPYIFQQENTGWVENYDGSLYVFQNLLVKRAQHEKILVGAKGKMIHEVTREANATLSLMLRRKVKVFLQVKVVDKFPIP